MKSQLNLHERALFTSFTRTSTTLTQLAETTKVFHAIKLRYGVDLVSDVLHADRLDHPILARISYLARRFWMLSVTAMDSFSAASRVFLSNRTAEMQKSGVGELIFLHDAGWA